MLMANKNIFFISLLLLEIKLAKNLFPGLLDGVMVNLHLLREVFFKPFVFFNVIVYKLDGELSVYLDGCFSFLGVVEPCLCPPSDARTVWIDANNSRYVETLNVEVKFCQWINESATGYCPVLCFFFSMALMDDRNI